MKKIIALSMAALLFGGIALTSCKKYEDGPSVSLLTKKMRLDGDWEVEAYFENGVDQTAAWNNTYSSETISISKDGTWNSSFTVNVLNTTFTASGTWEFDSSKEKITAVTTSTNPTSTDTWTILRLTNKEFWYSTVDGNDTEEIHLKAK